MSYFIKKTKTKKGLYLQIYRGEFNEERGYVVQTSYRPLGYYETLVKQGIKDPIAHFSEEVDELNAKERIQRYQAKSKVRQISEESPIQKAGFFPLKMVMNKLNTKPYIDLFSTIRDFQFSVYDVLSALVYARVVSPKSKHATFHEVLPAMYGEYDFSYEQILECCEFIGNDYEKFVEIFTAMTEEKYGINTSTTFFDCTNFYFEIDKEDDFRKKGPSKENRHDPIVGMGLLLDANCIPISMKLFPGNLSEKRVLREIISEMKTKTGAKGKTIQIADKGLNCARNIHEAINSGDGYIFSKSIKMQSKDEQEWAIKDYEEWPKVYDSNNDELYRYKEAVDTFTYSYFDDEGKQISFQIKEKRIVTYNPKLAEKQKLEFKMLYEKAKSYCYSKAKKSECGIAGKYMDFVSSKDGTKASACINENAYEKDKELAGFNMLVTSEYSADYKSIYDAYHSLWRIEESFRVMKSDLDARPVFLQNENSIKGHFLICYISVLLTRLLQFYELKGEFGTPELMHFMKSFNLIVNGKTVINGSAKTMTIEKLAKALDIPLLNYFFNPSMLKLMHLS